jgi:hypothetical protein
MAGLPAQTDLREGGDVTAEPDADAGAALGRIVQPALDRRHRENHIPGMTAVHSPVPPALRVRARRSGGPREIDDADPLRELEEAAMLMLLLGDRPLRRLGTAEIAKLSRLFGSQGDDAHHRDGRA